uniref:axonemal dynein light intermediate polypeptide 1 n=1 Tax=Gasterosteus aculeatus aculeatus TaxID=481459 RepID=UPI001A97D684|nr:axonemal dynein light intermediate polypeptide 1 [Gasterosteus aculeatus aculeatus]
MANCTPFECLVKYESPVLVERSNRKSTTPKSDDLRQEPKEILNRILPPREWMEGDQLWEQQVSVAPSTREDVSGLEELLDMKLQQWQARGTGICPLRRKLFSQCFDELIRQVTVECTEMGLLLLRVRDEIQMTLAAYRALSDSSMAFGMRKALQAELEKTIYDLGPEEREDLRKQLNQLTAYKKHLEKRENERRQVEEKIHTQEIQFLKRINQQLKDQLSVIIETKK